MNLLSPELPEIYDSGELQAQFLSSLGSGLNATGQDVAAALEVWSQQGDDQFKTTWGMLLAREILLRHWCGFDLPALNGHPLSIIRPFGRTKPALSDLLQRQGAMAMFPLLRRDQATGSAAALFLVEKKDGDDWADDSATLIPLLGEQKEALQNWHAFLVQGQVSMDGDSLQLAAHLALRAANESNQEALRALASSWAASGTVTGHRVGYVEVGNKLGAPDLGPRLLLLPEETRGSLLARQTEKGAVRVRFAADVDQAWARLATGAARHEGEGALPTQVPVLHSLVSGAWQPIMASIFMLRPKRLVLWASHAEVSQQPADAIREVLQHSSLDWLELAGQVVKRDISSENLAEANRQLSEILHQDLKAGQVWFNVTNGNRVMSYAALPFAQLNENLNLIYRDLDAEVGALTWLRYEGVSPVTQTVNGSKPGQVSLGAWENLFKTTPRKVDKAYLIQALELPPAA